MIHLLPPRARAILASHPTAAKQWSKDFARVAGHPIHGPSLYAQLCLMHLEEMMMTLDEQARELGAEK
jgi:hypothetical protein